MDLEINSKMLPADVGCVVDNVATVRAIYRAVAKTEPLMERGFTVSGDGVEKPCNLIVKIGTSFEEMLEAAGGFKDGEEPEKILCGGPMMGFAMPWLSAAVNKNNNALTVLKKKPNDGEKLYNLIYETYIAPEKLSLTDILYRLDMSPRHYYRLREQAITILSIRLWAAPGKDVDFWFEMLTLLEGLS